MALQKWVQKLAEQQTDTLEWRRYLHQHPELSFQEEKTAAFIQEKLASFGITEIRTGVGNGYGIVAKITGGKPGPTIALRADFDALAITEESDVAFRSLKPGVMHACGHDVHTASLLSVARVLAEHRAELAGSVVLLHQNAEEIQPGGAKSMVEAGALDGVDYVYGIHVSSNLPVGKVGYCTSYGSAASDTFTLSIQGKGGHAAHPNQTVDSVIVASQIIVAMQTLVSRKVDPIQPAVVTFGSVKAGGEAYNIIADTATIAGTIRTLDPAVRALTKAGLWRMVPLIAELQGAEVTIDYIDGYPSIMNTPQEVTHLVEVLERQFGAEVLEEIPVGMGGEDFSYFLEKKPGAFFYIGGENPEIAANYPHHHPKFKLDEGCVQQAGEAFLSVIASYLLE